MTQLHDPAQRGFASDNYAGIHPEILQAISEANGGHQIAYGGDVYTQRLDFRAKEIFGNQAEIYPVFNGTGANVTGLTAMLPRWGAIVASATAHIHTDENAAPERVSGLKLLTVQTPDGKLTPELIDQEAWGWGDEHRAQPLAVSITQSTELGTCYSLDELKAICDHAHSKGMTVHVDGARLANAAAHLGVGLGELTTGVGVDVLSLGGTKNGLLYGEAIVALNPKAAPGLNYLRKLNMQLASKMRFISAQFLALFEDDLWLRSASHANAMAAKLRSALDERIADGRVKGLSFSQATESNALFAVLPPGVADKLRESFRFYDWNQATGEVRWMCSFDTTEGDIDTFVEAITKELSA